MMGRYRGAGVGWNDAKDSGGRGSSKRRRGGFASAGQVVANNKNQQKRAVRSSQPTDNGANCRARLTGETFLRWVAAPVTKPAQCRSR
jgi:hypothetical protein